jgi:hypothetical protein
MFRYVSVICLLLIYMLVEQKAMRKIIHKKRMYNRSCQSQIISKFKDFI